MIPKSLLFVIEMLLFMSDTDVATRLHFVNYPYHAGTQWDPNTRSIIKRAPLLLCYNFNEFYVHVTNIIQSKSRLCEFEFYVLGFRFVSVCVWIVYGCV